MLFAHENGRVIPKEDKIFAINGRAKAMIAEEGKENVINATIGALLDDNGDLTVLSSVMKALGTLEPVDFAEYAPIGGTPEFKAAVEKALFGSKRPEGEVRVCATPGGTGAIRSVIANYSEPGDKVLTEVAGQQDSIVVIINTPAHNPTGYTLTDDDWRRAIGAMNDVAEKCKITLFIDVAYIDFAGDEEKARSFMPLLTELSENVLTVFGYSASMKRLPRSSGRSRNSPRAQRGRTVRGLPR